MENADRELIFKVMTSNSELKRLYQKHLTLEQKLADFENRNFLTPAEEVALKKLKKNKLLGVDQMMRILSAHREDAGLAA